MAGSKTLVDINDSRVGRYKDIDIENNYPC